MNPAAMQLKAAINNYARANNIAAQVVLQNFMFERFLARLARSPYKDHFLLKGGLLVASIVGLDARSTMDMDVTLQHYPLDAEKLRKAMSDIAAIPLDDGVSFRWVSARPTRADDVYGGLSIRFDAVYEGIVTALSLDVTVGDAVESSAPYEFCGIFEDELRFTLWGYSIETILAEKIETILRRGTLNTRPKDFYDVVALTRRPTPISETRLAAALQATAEHRGSAHILRQCPAILSLLAEDSTLKTRWQQYAKTYPYAAAISYEECMNSLRSLLQGLYETIEDKPET